MTRFILPVLLLTVLGLACCWHLTTVGVFNDDACYVLQARHLISGADYGPLQHLPGQGLVLVPAAAFGTLTAVRIEAVLLTLGGVVAWFFLASQWVDRASAALLAAAFGCNQIGWTYGSTAMSDVTFGLLVPLVLWGQVKRANPLLVGAGVGFAALCRAPALLLAGVFVADHVYRKDYRNGARMLAAVAVLLAIGLSSGVGGMLGSYASDGSSLWQTVSVGTYLVAWGHSMKSALGFFAGGWWWLAALVLPLSLVGLRSIPLMATFNLVYLALLIAWAYVEPRFLWPVWPSLLLLAVVRWPQRWRWGLLGALLLLNAGSLPGLLQQSRTYAAIEGQRWASFDWLAQHASGQKILAANHYFVMLRTGVRTVRLLPGPLDETLAQAYDAGVTWIYIDPTLDVSTQVTRSGAIPRLDLWLDRCSLVQRAFQTPWDRLYRIVAPAAPFQQAMRLCQDGLRLHRADLLEQALQLCPDLPAARVPLGGWRLADPHTAAAGEALLQAEVHQYPQDTQAVLLLAHYWQSQGRGAAAAALLQSARAEATAEGRDDDVRRL